MYIDSTSPEEPNKPAEGAASSNFKSASPSAHQEDLQDLARRTGDTSVYMYYYKSIGPRRTLCALGIIGAYVFASNFPRYWIQWYTNDPESRFATFLGVYFMLVVVASMSQGAIIW